MSAPAVAEAEAEAVKEEGSGAAAASEQAAQDEPAEPAEPRVADNARAEVAAPVGSIAGLMRELGAGGDEPRRIAVLGVVRNVGTTVTAITLARMLAKQGRVVLIDLALSAPNLAAIATDPAVPGVSRARSGLARPLARSSRATAIRECTSSRPAGPRAGPAKS